MRGYTVRFEVNGVWNQSDPFRTEEAAVNYAEHLDRYGGVAADRVTPVQVDWESKFADSSRYGP